MQNNKRQNKKGTLNKIGRLNRCGSFTGSGNKKNPIWKENDACAEYKDIKMKIKQIIKTTIKHIPKDFSKVLSFDILSKFLAAVMTIALIRILSTRDYAAYVKFYSISTFIHGVFGTGIAISLIRYLTEEISRGRESSRGLHFVAVLLILPLSIFLLSLTNVIGILYQTSRSVVVYGCIFGFVLSLIQINQSYYQARENYNCAGIIQNLRYIFLLSFLFLIWLAVGEISLEPVLFAYIICGSLTFIVGLYWIYYRVPIKEYLVGANRLGEMLKSSLWMVLYCIFLNFLNQVDIIMLTNMTTDIDVAMYGVAYKYYGLMLTLLPSIMAVLRVRSSQKEYIDSAEKRRTFAINWINKTWKISSILCLFAIASCGFIMPILNGPDYDASINIFRIFVIGVGISYVFAANVHMMMSAKKQSILCLLAFVALIINIGTNMIFIPLWGTVGAALATILSHAFINVSSTIIILRSDIKNIEEWI